MHKASPSTHARWFVAATSVAMLAGLGLPVETASAAPQAPAAGVVPAISSGPTAARADVWTPQPIVNQSFRHGSTGWHATGEQDFLRPTDRGYRGRAIVLRTSAVSTAALNDERNVVEATLRDRHYRAWVWVRTTTPGVDVQLRLREVSAGAEVKATTKTTRLTNKRWHKLAIRHVAVAHGSTLDLNVVSWDLAPRENVLIDGVRLHVRDSVTEPDPEPDPNPTPNDCLMGTASAQKCGVMWGIYTKQVSAAEGWAKPFTDLESEIGRKFDVVKRYHDWSNEGGSGQFPDAYERQLGADGKRILYFAWTSNVWSTGSTTRWASIASGRYDQSVILPAAKRIKAWGHPVFIDFDHEMDGHTRTTLGSPADYVAAHRHIVDVFNRAGVKNVIWAWVPTGTMENRERIKAMYPGDKYVDWVGYDPYNFYSCNGSGWETPTQSLKPFYDWMSANITNDKPVLLGEYGSVSDRKDPQRVEKWYADMGDALATMPRIRAVMQWNSQTSAACDFRITRDPQALDGFIEAGKDSYVLGAS